MIGGLTVVSSALIFASCLPFCWVFFICSLGLFLWYFKITMVLAFPKRDLHFWGFLSV